MVVTTEGKNQLRILLLSDMFDSLLALQILRKIQIRQI